MNGQIRHTSDYDKFELLQFNREVRKIKNLERSMREHDWIDAYPMHVVRGRNSKLLIKAGHHRFVVARKLEIPVKYVVCNDSTTIHELEKATNPWKLEDYLGSFVQCGRTEYIVVKKYRERTGINLFACISMLAGQSAASNNQAEKFKSGNYTLSDPHHAEMVADIVLHLKQHGVKWASNNKMVQAISRVVWVKEFDPNVFKQKVETFHYLFEKQKNVSDYINLLDMIYNRSSRSRVPISFLSDEVARERSAAPRSFDND